MDQQFENTLKRFSPISLQEMDSVKLLNRIDTKYTFRPDNINELLTSLQSAYRILEINGNRMSHYQTLYFDTPNYQLYLDHHNDRANRYKLRFRKYLDSNLCYLEMKFKTQKERTDKKRTKKNEIETSLSETSIKYIEKHLKKNSPFFVPILWNKFTRLTFVHLINPERLTIDIDVEFTGHQSDRIIQLPNIVIAEVKREKATSHSDFVQIMRRNGIHEVSFSKYCMGALLLNKTLKYNKFKPQLLTLKKLTNEYIKPFTA